jgi:hypothetical protein
MVPDVVYWEQAAAGDELVAGSGKSYVRRDKLMLPEYYGGWEGKVTHFLSPHKTVEKI